MQTRTHHERGAPFRPIGCGRARMRSGSVVIGIVCFASGSRSPHASEKSSMSFLPIRSVFVFPSEVKLSRMTAITRLSTPKRQRIWNETK